MHDARIVLTPLTDPYDAWGPPTDVVGPRRLGSEVVWLRPLAAVGN
jgi:hypothetical protein